MKKISIITLIIVSLFAFIFFGFKLFVTSIVNQRGCEFANIDNVEVNMGVDIPKVEISQCDYNVELKVKSVYFKFKPQNAQKYISKFNFKKIGNIDKLEKRFSNFVIGDLKSIASEIDYIFVKKEERKNNSSYAIYNSKTNEFWGIILFKN